MEIIPSTQARPRRTGRVALGVLGAAFVVAAILAAFPVWLGMERVPMADDAMAPDLPKGSYTLVRRVAADEVEVGDVVSVRDPAGERSLIRRVTAMEGGWLELSGDAEGTERMLVRAVRLREVVSHVPWAGYPMMVLPAWPAPYLVLGLTGALLLAGLRITGQRSRRRAAAPPPLVIPRQSPGPARQALPEPGARGVTATRAPVRLP